MDRTVLKLLAVNRSYRTSEVYLLLCAVTNHNNLIELLVVRLKSNVHVVVSCNCSRVEANVGNINLASCFLKV